MRRLFCYTLSARAIGATVSAGALHAQGWGFESLIAHHRIGNGPRKGTVLFAPISWDSNPPGCGAEETRSVFQRSTQGAKRRSGARPPTRRTRNPSVPYQQRAPHISTYQPNRHLGTFLKCRSSTWCRAAPAGRRSITDQATISMRE